MPARRELPNRQLRKISADDSAVSRSELPNRQLRNRWAPPAPARVCELPNRQLRNLTQQTTLARPRELPNRQLRKLPVATELIALAKKLNAMAYLSCYGCETSQQAVAYRDQLGGREAVLIYPDFVSWDTQANADLAGYATARAAGLRAQIDHDRGWHKTLSNVLVQGATGISQPVFFDLQEPSAESNYLNSHQITTLVRQGGLKFWGGYTLDDSGLYPFEN